MIIARLHRRQKILHRHTIRSHERGSSVMVESAAEFLQFELSGRWISLAALVCCAAIFVTGCGGRQPVASAPPVTNTTPEPAPPPCLSDESSGGVIACGGYAETA